MFSKSLARKQSFPKIDSTYHGRKSKSDGKINAAFSATPSAGVGGSASGRQTTISAGGLSAAVNYRCCFLSRILFFIFFLPRQISRSYKSDSTLPHKTYQSCVCLVDKTFYQKIGNNDCSILLWWKLGSKSRYFGVRIITSLFFTKKE